MAMSGYGQDMRIEVLRSGVKRYRNMKRKKIEVRGKMCRRKKKEE